MKKGLQPMTTGLEQKDLSIPVRHGGRVHPWNDTARDYPPGWCAHQLVEAQARRTPDAVAVSCGDLRLTYRELDARANQAARLLRRHGVGADVLVGVYMERSLELVVAMLGVLKAGGAYVPLDPAYPRARVQLMLADTRVPVLLTQPALAGRVEAGDAFVVAIDGSGSVARCSALGTMTMRAPRLSGTHVSATCTSKQTEVEASTDVPSPIARTSGAQWMSVATLEWRICTPLGVPVLPEV